LREAFGIGKGHTPQGAKPQEHASTKKKNICDSPFEMNYSIFWDGHKRLGPEEIVRSIMEFDAKTFNGDFAKLGNNIPTHEEIEKAIQCEDEIAANFDDYDNASKWVYTARTIPRFEQRVKLFVLEQNLSKWIRNTKDDLSRLRALSETLALAEADSLGKFLHITLCVGNRINKGHKRGGAYGFQPAYSLEKMALRYKCRSNLGRTSDFYLLGYIMEECYHLDPSLLDWVDPYSRHLELTQAVDITMILKSVEEMKKNVFDVARTLKEELELEILPYGEAEECGSIGSGLGDGVMGEDRGVRYRDQAFVDLCKKVLRRKEEWGKINNEAQDVGVRFIQAMKGLGEPARDVENDPVGCIGKYLRVFRGMKETMGKIKEG
jgi:hypothetical protein